MLKPELQVQGVVFKVLSSLFPQASDAGCLGGCWMGKAVRFRRERVTVRAGPVQTKSGYQPAAITRNASRGRGQEEEGTCELLLLGC